MASGSGISYINFELDENIYPTYDLVLCAKFEDIYGFFSLRELFYSQNYNLQKTGFIYDFKFNNKFTSSTAYKLENSNSFIGIKNGKIINKKRNLRNLFKLDENYLKGADPGNVEKIFKLSNKDFDLLSNLQMFFYKNNNADEMKNFLTDNVIKGINEKFSSDNVVVFRTVVKNNFYSKLIKEQKVFTPFVQKKCLESLLKESQKNCSHFRGLNFCKEKNYIHPLDLIILNAFFSVSRDELEITYIKQQDFPRLASKGVIQKILNSNGVIETDTGSICYDIDFNDIDPEENISDLEKRRETTEQFTPIELKLLQEKTNEEDRRKLENKIKEEKKKMEEKEKQKNKKYALFSNIETKNNIVTKVNFENFNKYLTTKNKFCDPGNFKLKDEIIGKFEDGYYNLLCPNDLTFVKDTEINFFMDSIEENNYNINLVSYYKKKMTYPRRYGDFLITRESIQSPPFITRESLPSSEDYAKGFISTLQSINIKKLPFNFGFQLLQSLYIFIKDNYKDYYALPGVFSDNFKQLYNYIYTNSKVYSYKIIQNLFVLITNIKDPIKSVISFFDNKKLKKIPSKKDENLLRLVVISYFITCNLYEDNCSFINIKNDKHQIISILDSKIYFDAVEKIPVFKDTDLLKKI